MGEGGVAVGVFANQPIESNFFIVVGSELGFEGFQFADREIAEPLLGGTESEIGFESFLAPEFVELREEKNSAELGDGPEGCHNAGKASLEQAGGQRDRFVGQFDAGEAGFAGGENGEADAVAIAQLEIEDVAQGEEFFVVHQQAAVEGFVEVGGAVAEKVDDLAVGQSIDYGSMVGFMALQHLRIWEGSGYLANFVFEVAQVLGGVVDRENGIGVGDAPGDRAGGGDRLGVGGVGEAEFVEGVAFAGGLAGVGSPGGVEGQQAEVAGGNEGGAIARVLPQAIEEGGHQVVPELLRPQFDLC